VVVSLRRLLCWGALWALQGCSGCSQSQAESTDPGQDGGAGACSAAGGAGAGACVDAGNAGAASSAHGGTAQGGAAQSGAHSGAGGGNGGASAKDGGGPDANGGGAGGSYSTSWPGWEEIPGLEGCKVFRPVELEKVIPPLTWSPCDAMPGCMKMDTPWYNGKHDPLVNAVFKKYQGKEYLGMMQRWGSLEIVVALYSLTESGKPLAAWAGQGCMRIQDIWHDQAVFNIIQASKTTNSNIFGFVIGPAEQLGSLPETFSGTTKEPAFAGGISDIHLGDGILAWRGPSIGIYDALTKEVSTVQLNEPQELFYPRVAGRDVFFVNRASPTYDVWVRRGSGDVEKLRHVDGSHVHWFDADGFDMAWIEFSQPLADDPVNFASAVLWTSPYANHAANVKPTKLSHVASLEGGPLSYARTAVNDGMAIVDWDSERVYRLSDGSHYEVPISVHSGTTRAGALFADKTEIVAMIKGPFYSTLARIPIAALPVHPPVP
jgi:hypothetical protein